MTRQQPLVRWHAATSASTTGSGILLRDHRRRHVWGARIGLPIVWSAVLSQLTGDRAPWVWPQRNVLDLVAFTIVPALALLMLALGSEVVLEEYLSGTMRCATRQLLFWTPRVLGLLYGLMLFILTGEALSELLVLPVVLAATWRWEWLGVIVFGCFALWGLSMHINHMIPSALCLVLVGIPLLIATLLALNWAYHREARSQLRSAVELGFIAATKVEPA